jgi:hypothetical protein
VVSQQELLKKVDGEMKELKLRKVARFYRAQQAGQDKWFLNDVMKVEGALVAMVGPRHAAAQAAVAVAMEEAMAAGSDGERLAVVQALEAANYLVVEAVANYLERMGVAGGLEYFSWTHLEAMGEHEVLKKQIDAIVAGIEMSDAERAAACARVDRIFAAFRTLLDSCDAVCAAAARAPAFHMAQRLMAVCAASRIAA